MVQNWQQDETTEMIAAVELIGPNIPETNFVANENAANELFCKSVLTFMTRSSYVNR